MVRSRVSGVNGSIQNNIIVDSFFYRNSCENTPATPATKLQVIFPLLSRRNVFFFKNTPCRSIPAVLPIATDQRTLGPLLAAPESVAPVRRRGKFLGGNNLTQHPGPLVCRSGPLVKKHRGSTDQKNNTTKEELFQVSNALTRKTHLGYHQMCLILKVLPFYLVSRYPGYPM